MSAMNETPAPPPFLPYWRSVWLKPRQTMAAIYAAPRHALMWLPAIVGGIALMMEAAIVGKFWTQLPFGQVWMASLLLGPLAGMLNVGILGFFVRQFGKLMQGEGDATRIRLALSWATVPVAFALIPTAIEYYLRATEGESLLTSALLWLRTGLGIWGVLLMCLCVAEAQCFSFKQGALNVLSIFVFFNVLMFLLVPR